MLLERFCKKGERPNDETAEDSKISTKKKAAFKRNYHESYSNWFIATGDMIGACFVYCVATGYNEAIVYNIIIYVLLHFYCVLLCSDPPTPTGPWCKNGSLINFEESLKKGKESS